MTENRPKGNVTLKKVGGVLGLVAIGVVSTVVGDLVLPEGPQQLWYQQRSLLATAILVALAVGSYWFLHLITSTVNDTPERPFTIPFLNSYIGAALLGAGVASVASLVSLIPIWEPLNWFIFGVMTAYGYELLTFAIFSIWIFYFVARQNDALSLIVHAVCAAVAVTIWVNLIKGDSNELVTTLISWLSALPIMTSLAVLFWASPLPSFFRNAAHELTSPR